MLNRLLLLILSGALLMQCAPADSTPQALCMVIPKNAERNIASRAELRACQTEWVNTAQTPVYFRLAASQRERWREYIGEELWAEYARRTSARVLETGQVSLQLVYRDYVRLRAALRHADIRAGLSGAEERVLQVLEQRTREILRPGMSDFEKVVALHDALVQQSRYNAGAGGNIEDLLTKGCGSCEAYSSTLCIMLDIAGVPSRLVTGTADGPHAWNLVQVDGEWYHVDATWDDPVVGDGSRQILQHSYCFCNDEEMSRTHRWERSDYPSCDSRTAFYYRRSGLYFTRPDAYWKAALAAYARGEGCFEGYLTTYGSARQFQKVLEVTPSDDAPSQIRWTGPETESGTVMMSFGSN